MTVLSRLERLARDVPDLEPDHDVVCAAMAEFRRTGRLPRDTKTAWAVAKWADTGEPPGEDAGQRVGGVSIYVGDPKSPPPPRDVVMQGLYEDAVFGDELEQTVARVMLVTLAKAGFDPSTPVWGQLGWETPAMTCSSMALTLLGFPGSFVLPEHRQRTVELEEKLRSMVISAQHGALLAAAEEFLATGRQPADPAVTEAILWNAEMCAYCQTWLTGEDNSRLIEAFRAYWEAPPSGRDAALAEVLTAAREMPEPVAVGYPHLWSKVKQLLLPFLSKVMDAVEQTA